MPALIRGPFFEVYRLQWTSGSQEHTAIFVELNPRTTAGDANVVVSVPEMSAIRHSWYLFDSCKEKEFSNLRRKELIGHTPAREYPVRWHEALGGALARETHRFFGDDDPSRSAGASRRTSASGAIPTLHRENAFHFVLTDEAGRDMVGEDVAHYVRPRGPAIRTALRVLLDAGLFRPTGPFQLEMASW